MRTARTISRDLSEVDLSDPEDVKITVSDPQGEVLVHLGSSGFADASRFIKATCRNGGSSSSIWIRWTCVTTGR